SPLIAITERAEQLERQLPVIADRCYYQIWSVQTSFFNSNCGEAREPAVQYLRYLGEEGRARYYYLLLMLSIEFCCFSCNAGIEPAVKDPCLKPDRTFALLVSPRQTESRTQVDPVVQLGR